MVFCFCFLVDCLKLIFGYFLSYLAFYCILGSICVSFSFFLPFFFIFFLKKETMALELDTGRYKCGGAWEDQREGKTMIRIHCMEEEKKKQNLIMLTLFPLHTLIFMLFYETGSLCLWDVISWLKHQHSLVHFTSCRPGLSPLTSRPILKGLFISLSYLILLHLMTRVLGTATSCQPKDYFSFVGHWVNWGH